MTCLLIGFGNPDRGDDAAGPLLARRLRNRFPGRVLERHGDALALPEEWRGADCLILVDAAASLGEPGRIHRIDLAETDLPRDMAFGSTHAFGLPEAVALSRRLGTLPRQAVVYAIEGACFAPGDMVTPMVGAAIARLAEVLAVRSPCAAP